MRLTTEILNATVFICRRRSSGNVERAIPVATGFVASVPINSELDAGYVVTARHVIEDDRNAPVLIRGNTKSGASATFVTEGLAWYVHDSADVAIHPFPLGSHPLGDPYNATRIPIRTFISDGPKYEHTLEFEVDGEKQIERKLVVTGDDVAVVGLFVEDFGETQNLPIARFGHIARMPSIVHTPRWTGDNHRSAAYLIECLSWSGMSGSPVMCFQEVFQTINRGKLQLRESRYVPALLGCINGHVNRSATATIDRRDDGSMEEIVTALNTGIAVVTPSSAIRELLFCEEVQQDRLAMALKMGVPEPYVTLGKVAERANQQRPLPSD